MTGELARLMRKRIDALQSLGMEPAVAVRLVELGRNDDAELEEYEQVVNLSTELVTKLLAFANSSWFSPRQPIVSLHRALAMIGTNQVRALGVSYCLDALHHALDLDEADARALWTAALWKAVAARELTARQAPEDADEAFAVGLLQDIGLAVLASTSSGPIMRALQNPDLALPEQLLYESGRFGMDHGEAGDLVARHMGLPESFVAAIGHHHGDCEQPIDSTKGSIHLASRMVAWLPHDNRCWKPHDLARFSEMLGEHHGDDWSNVETFLTHVQAGFDDLVEQLQMETVDRDLLAETVRAACVDNAGYVENLSGELQSIVVRHERLSGLIDDITSQQALAEFHADHDSLTRLLNRTGLQKRAAHILPEASTNARPIGLAFFDCDGFKKINDEHGHDAGDALLKTVVARMRSNLRDRDMMCRWGGDELVILAEGMSSEGFIAAMRRLQEAVARDPFAWQDKRFELSVTGGLAWRDQLPGSCDLDELVKEADENLYVGKRGRRGSLVSEGQIVD
ncbi:MAG: GGDEF domain-containing protein [Phycisphaerae bacterium]|nr:GGDEF domain-containing protein [Phycisphaerae bacterium]